MDGKIDRRKNDPTLEWLMKIDSKVDALVLSIESYKRENDKKCSDCKNGINDRLEPIENDRMAEQEKSKIGYKIITYLKSPALIASAVLSALIFTVSFTTALTTGKHSTDIANLKAQVQALKTDPLTPDQITNFLHSLKNYIQ